GQEVTFAYYNATLRDWARLGLMLAHRGQWNGRQIVPQSWIEASTVAKPDWPQATYGYHIWISPLDSSRFYFLGLRNQLGVGWPSHKSVLVQPALEGAVSVLPDLAELFTAARAKMP